MNADTGVIDAVLIPLHGVNLLLPNVCVAEVLPWRRLAQRNVGPRWLLGDLDWRDRHVAIVAYEALTQSEDGALPPNETGACQVVMNRSRCDGTLEFYGVAAQGLPRLLHLAREDLEWVADGMDTELINVRVGTEEALVPNLARVEQRIEDGLRQAG